MKTKKKRILVISAIILVIAIAYLFSSNNSPFAIGSSTLSLSNAELTSSHPLLSGKAWLLTFTQGVLSQRYYGYFTPSNVQTATDDSSTTTKPFSIEVQYDNQVCSYPITGTSSNIPIYDIQRITWTYVPFIDSCDEAEAKSKGLSTVLYFGKYSTSVTCFAIGYNTQSPVGNINSPSVTSSYTINVDADGTLASKTINTIGSGQGQIGDFAYAVWQGNLVSGQSCADKSPYLPVYVNGVWRIGSKNYYDTYRSLLVTSPSATENNQNIWLNNIQNQIANAKLSQNFGSLNSATSFNNAVIQITLENPIQFPVTTLYIKADKIGIYTPSPKFELFDSTSSCFKTGEQGTISVGIKNTGDEYGSANIWATCDNPFTSTSNVQVGLNAGQSATRQLPISATATQDTNANCVVHLESVGGDDQVNVGVCVKPQITCTPNQVFCAIDGNNEVIKRCSSNGATTSIIEVCGVGEFCENAQCKLSSSGGSGDNFLDKINNFFKGIFGFFGDTFNLIKFIVMIIGFIFSMLFSKDLFSNFKALKRKEGLAWMFALMIGLLVAILIFTLFWIGVIIAGIIVLARVIIKFFIPG